MLKRTPYQQSHQNHENENRFSAYQAKKSCGGAVTVEYAVIFPLIIVCILVLIYLGMLYYQQCLMQSVVSENVQNLSFLWGYDPSEIDVNDGITNRDVYVNEGLYWHIFTDVDKRKGKVIQTVQNELMKKSVVKPWNGFDIEVTYGNFLVYKKIGIKAKATYPLPFKNLFKLFGSAGLVPIETYSETVINDPQDFIQNIDYLFQIYEESGAKDWVKEKCEPLADILKKIKTYFN